MKRPPNSDLGLAAINKTYDQMGIDAEWTVWEPRGFTWWGWHSAQRIWSEPAVHDRGFTLYRLHARAELFDGFEDTDKQVLLLNLLGMQMTLSGIVACTDRPGRIELAASVYVHEENFDWAQDFFSSAVGMQAAEAAIWAEQLPTTMIHGLRRVTSAHPQSGPRAEMDEMLDLIKGLVHPKGQAQCHYAGKEMERLLATFQQPPCVWANGDKEGLLAEFPYPDRGGTSLLELKTTEEDPRAGNGLIVRLKIPEGGSDAATARKALEWNNKELSCATWARFLGTWCALETGLTYVSFCPNFACRKGCLGTIASSQVVRARWLTEQVMGYNWDEHFEEALERKKAVVESFRSEDLQGLPFDFSSIRGAGHACYMDEGVIEFSAWSKAMLSTTPRSASPATAKKAVKAMPKLPEPIMADSDDDLYDYDPEEVFTCYSVGGYGIYPIWIRRRRDKYFFLAPEFAEEGPYDSLEAALEAAEHNWLGDDGGFWKTFEEAEKHRQRMLDKGYAV